MKAIVKLLFLMVVVAFVATSCQKDTDDFNVSLKSSGILKIYENWQSGDAAFECGQAGGNCGYGYKIDEWDEVYGMDGVYETSEGNFITILNSDGKTFDWTSEAPVCKVIVKAGRGAYVYSYANGAYSDEGLIGFQGKGISHVTFCYGESPDWVIALKSYLEVPGLDYAYAVSGGEGSSTNSLFMGYNVFSLGQTNEYPLNFMWSQEQVGIITATDYWENDVHFLEVRITFDENHNDWKFKGTFLYVGTLEGYEMYLTEVGGIFYTNYGGFPFFEDQLTSTRIFKIPFSQITE